jgi:hypothetical protein
VRSQGWGTEVEFNESQVVPWRIGRLRFLHCSLRSRVSARHSVAEADGNRTRPARLTAAAVLKFGAGRGCGCEVVLVQWRQGRKVVVWPPAVAQARSLYPRHSDR